MVGNTLIILKFLCLNTKAYFRWEEGKKNYYYIYKKLLLYIILLFKP